MDKKLLYLSVALSLLCPTNNFCTYAQNITGTELHSGIYDAKTFYLMHAFAFHTILQKIKIGDIETKKLYKDFVENFYKDVEFILEKAQQKDYKLESEGHIYTPEFKKFAEDIESVKNVRNLVDSKILAYEQNIQETDKLLEEKKKSIKTLNKLRKYIKVDGADVEKFIPTVIEVYDELFYKKD